MSDVIFVSHFVSWNLCGGIISVTHRVYQNYKICIFEEKFEESCVNLSKCLITYWNLRLGTDFLCIFPCDEFEKDEEEDYEITFSNILIIHKENLKELVINFD